jgi:hypothetical protein
VARADWPGLPAGLRRAIENHTGPVVAARPVTTGFGAELLAVLRTAGGEVFVKGLQAGDPRMWAHEAEAVVVQGADAGVLAGHRLIHCDLNPSNFRIGENGGDVRLVEGHGPARAEDWARRLPAWGTALAGAVTMFAAGIRRQWEDAAREAPDAGRRHMAAVARRWVRHRYAAATDSAVRPDLTGLDRLGLFAAPQQPS